jgi:hypothetical protein
MKSALIIGVEQRTLSNFSCANQIGEALTNIPAQSRDFPTPAFKSGSSLACRASLNLIPTNTNCCGVARSMVRAG